MTSSQEKTDAFLQIAQRAEAAGEGLIEPQPLPLTYEQVFRLRAGDTAVCAAPIPESQSWFDSELGRLREVWKPYLSNCAPVFTTSRQQTELVDFEWRHGGEPGPERLPDALMGRGDWQSVTVPHYGPPIGRATVFYRKEFSVPQVPGGKRVWLHFEGVDYLAKVFVNETYIGDHEGIVGPFEFDITDYLNGEDEKNVLLIQVDNDAIMMGNDSWDSKDAGDKLYAATGPGWDEPHIGWHHCPPGMGIYRRVYLETRPEVFIEDAWVRPLLTENAIELWLEVQAREAGEAVLTALVQIHGRNFEGEVLPETELELTGLPGVGRNFYRLRLPLRSDRLWTIETPWLHSLHLRLGDDAQTIVFGLRDFRMEVEEAPKGRLFLNGQPIRLRGINTMGHEQLCVMEKNHDQLLDDLLIYKMAGINYIRFTQRPVDHEVLELCDALGLMAQADLPLFKNLRRNQFNEAVRQTSELERFVRRHPSVMVTSFFNEPFPLSWHNALHRHLGKDELNRFFDSASNAVLLENPDRVIKPVDGDYDPPSPGLPDNHCYTLWYNGHMIEFGKLAAGYWQPVKPGWHYACGEYGAEGLDPVDLMRRRYPVDWLPQSEDEEASWMPRRIRKAQSGDMYQVFYDKPDSLQGWVEASQDFQAWTVTEMTEAFRRDPRMVSFALHLGIDAFPSGWMKTIVDCERRPKKAYFAFRDALAPVLPSLRAPRRFWWDDETFSAELWVSNDRPRTQSGLELRAELRQGERVIAFLLASLPELPACDVLGLGRICFALPKVDARSALLLRIQILDTTGQLLGQSEHEFDVFARRGDLPELDLPGELTPEMIERARSGETVLCGPLPHGTYDVLDEVFEVAPIGMGELTFCSRATGHPMVEGFAANDFRLWFDERVGYASPFADSVIVGEGWSPILLAGRGGFGEMWTPHPVVAEKQIGAGSLILCQLKLPGRVTHNPPAALFLERLALSVKKSP
ncbi:MAG: sugar-binding domain-containing protein [Kiritimatiellia bacterium]